MNILAACLCQLLLPGLSSPNTGRDIAPANSAQNDLGLLLLQSLFGLSSSGQSVSSAPDTSVSSLDGLFEKLLLALNSQTTEASAVSDYPVIAELIKKPDVTTTTSTPVTTTSTATTTVPKNEILDLGSTGAIDPSFFKDPPAKVRYKGELYSLRAESKVVAGERDSVYYRSDNRLKQGLNNMTVRKSGNKATIKTSDSSGSLSGYGSSGTVDYAVNTYSPLVFDLKADGKTTAASRQKFDIDNDGQLDTINNVANGDGLLVMDHDGDGNVGENASELFGNYTANQKFANGFEALKAIAKKELGDAAVADGKLDAKEIAALEAKIKLGLKVDGAVKTLSSLGISNINLNYNVQHQGVDAHGNVMGESSAFTQNGEDKAIIDVWFKKH